MKLTLTDIVKIVFKKGNEFAEIEIPVEDMLEKTTEELFEILEDTKNPCTSSGCNNESQPFCDCGTIYDDYEILEIIKINKI